MLSHNAITTDNARFEGVMSLLLTPFHEDLSIDWTAYEKYVEWQLRWDPHGFFAVCGTSEMKWLTLPERLKLARLAVKHAGNKPVVATANLEPDISEHQDEIAQMIETGVSGIVLVPPPGLGEDPPALEDYYARLIEAATVPVFLYEWPQVQPYLLDPEIFGRLVTTHGLAGIKDTTCTLEGVRAKIEAAPGAIVYQANMPYLLDAVRAGARGIMAVTTAACADLALAFWKSATEGDDTQAERYHYQLVTLDAVQRFGYPATAKYLAGLRGVDIGVACRWPIPFPKEAAKAMDLWYKNYEKAAAERPANG